MSVSFELSAEAREALTKDYLVPEAAVDLAEITMQELIEVAASVGRDYDEAEGDYPNLAGLMCSGRTRNRVARRIRRDEIPDGLDVDAVGTGPAIVLSGGGTDVHPYSCGS